MGGGSGLAPHVREGCGAASAASPVFPPRLLCFSLPLRRSDPLGQLTCSFCSELKNTCGEKKSASARTGGAVIDGGAGRG